MKKTLPTLGMVATFLALALLLMQPYFNGTVEGPTQIGGTTANWVSGTPNMNDDANDLEFGTVALQSPGNTTANNTNSLFELNSITFGSTAGASFNLTGSSIEFRDDSSTTPSITQNSSFNQTISAALVNDGGTLTLTGNGTGVLTIGALNTNGQATTKSGTSTYVFNGAVSGGGTLTISAGTISIGNGGTTGSVANTIANNATLIFNRSDALTHSNNISGTGVVTKQGGGTTTLSGSNTYSGGTNLNAGILTLGSSGAIGTTGTISFGGGTLQFSASNTTDYSARFSTAASQAYSIDTNGQTVALASALTSSGGTLAKLGTGTLTLSGAAANTYNGLTTVTGGQLDLSKTAGVNAIGDGLTINGASAVVRLVNDNQIIDSSAVTITAGTFNMNSKNETIGSLSGAGAVTNMGTLTLAGTASTTYSGNASGTGSLVKSSTSTGTTTLSGSNSYSGGTTLNGGILALGSSGAIGTTGTISFGGGTLQFSGSNTTDYSARFSNAASQAYRLDTNGQSVTLATALTSSGGTLTKLGAGTLTTTAANTYSSTTTISAGTLAIGNGGTTGSVADGITNNAALIFNRSNALTHSGDISGTGTLTKQGAGQLDLTGTNTYGGTTTISAGTLSIGNGGTTGSVTSDIVDNAALIFNRSDSLAFSSNISGTGSVTKQGAGTTTLSGSNSYGGGTTLSAGTLALGSSGAIGTTGTVSFGGGTLQFSASNTTDYSARFSNAAGQAYSLDTNGQSVTLATGLTSSGGTLTKLGTGTLAMTGANTYTGTTTISAGTLSVGNSGTTGSISGAITNNAALIFNRSNSLTHSGNISGTGTLTKQGAGVLTLSGANIYSGGTTLSAGTLALGSSGAIGTTGTIDFNGGTLQFSASNTTDYSARFSNAAGQAYSLDTNGQSATLATALTSSGGTLTKLGAGTLSLTAANIYSGATTVSAGTLEVTNASGSGTGSGNITVSSGNLNVGNGGTAGSVSGDISNNGTVNFNRSDDTSYSGQISGSGIVNKRGAGNLTLSGSSNHAGGTKQYDGGLKIGHKNALGTGTYTIGDATTSTTLKVSSTTNLTGANAVGNAVTVAKDFTVESGSSDLELSGAVDLGVVNRTVTVDSSNLTVVSGVIGDGGSGTGALTKAGAGVLTLSGANNYGGGTTVNNGILRTANTTGSGTGSGNVTVAGGTLDVQAGSSITSPSILLTSGTMIVNGTANGPTSITGGNVQGTGTINGAVTVNGGTLEAGNSIGTLNLAGTLTLTSGIFDWEFSSGTVTPLTPMAADLTNVSGGLDIAAATILSVANLGTNPFGLSPSPFINGTKFTVISYAGTWNNGKFGNTPNNNDYYMLGGQLWRIKYDDTPAGTVNGGAYANAVTMMAVPEASTFLIIGLGGVFAFAAVRLSKRMGIDVLSV